MLFAGGLAFVLAKNVNVSLQSYLNYLDHHDKAPIAMRLKDGEVLATGEIEYAPNCRLDLIIGNQSVYTPDVSLRP